MYKRILLKLSGEALGLKGSDNIIDAEVLKEVAKSIKDLYDGGLEIAIVIGAGNIWRGRVAEKIGIERVPADFMGMLGTVINAVAMSSALKNLGVPSVVYSAIPEIPGVTVAYDEEKAKNDLSNKKVCFLAGGTGKPYFSTDTAAVLRAKETNCDSILMAKNGVEGVYDKDPREYVDAKFLPVVSFQEMLDLKLGVMDEDAVKLIKDTNLEILVFSMSDPNNFKRVANGEHIGTVCKKEK